MDPLPVIFDISSDDEEPYCDEPGGDDYDWLSEILKSVEKPADESDDVVVVSEVNPRKRAKFSKPGEKDFDEDCVILDGDPDKTAGVVNEPETESDELLIVGEKGQVACRDFPHSRQHCAKFPFNSTPHDKHCHLCHCYVCDSIAPCSHWGNGSSEIDHCHATEKEETWKLQRSFRQGKSAPLLALKLPHDILSTPMPQLNQATQTIRQFNEVSHRNNVQPSTIVRSTSNPVMQNNVSRPTAIRACTSSTNFGISSGRSHSRGSHWRHNLAKSRSHHPLVSQPMVGHNNGIMRKERDHNSGNLGGARLDSSHNSSQRSSSVGCELQVNQPVGCALPMNQSKERDQIAGKSGGALLDPSHSSSQMSSSVGCELPMNQPVGCELPMNQPTERDQNAENPGGARLDPSQNSSQRSHAALPINVPYQRPHSVRVALPINDPHQRSHSVRGALPINNPLQRCHSVGGALPLNDPHQRSHSVGGTLPINDPHQRSHSVRGALPINQPSHGSPHNVSHAHASPQPAGTPPPVHTARYKRWCRMYSQSVTATGQNLPQTSIALPQPQVQIHSVSQPIGSQNIYPPANQSQNDCLPTSSGSQFQPLSHSNGGHNMYPLVNQSQNAGVPRSSGSQIQLISQSNGSQSFYPPADQSQNAIVPSSPGSQLQANLQPPVENVQFQGPVPEYEPLPLKENAQYPVSSDVGLPNFDFEDWLLQNEPLPMPGVPGGSEPPIDTGMLYFDFETSWNGLTHA